MGFIKTLAGKFCGHQTLIKELNSLIDGYKKALTNKVQTNEVPSPGDRIPPENIIYNKVAHKIEILGILPNIWLVEPQDTNSMDPTVDIGHTLILTDNFKPDDLSPGDIVAYQLPEKPYLILHRIVRVETDSQGRKWTFKGDNNYSEDRYEVRDEHLKWLKLGVIY